MEIIAFWNKTISLRVNKFDRYLLQLFLYVKYNKKLHESFRLNQKGQNYDP